MFPANLFALFDLQNFPGQAATMAVIGFQPVMSASLAYAEDSLRWLACCKVWTILAQRIQDEILVGFRGQIHCRSQRLWRNRLGQQRIAQFGHVKMHHPFVLGIRALFDVNPAFSSTPSVCDTVPLVRPR